MTYKDETYYLPWSASTTAILPAREMKETSFPLPTSPPRPTVVTSQAEILQLLREQIELVSQTTSAHGFDITAKLNGVEIKANTWRDILTGFAETFIRLGREGEIQDHIYDSQEQRESDYSFRQLSNSKYLRVPGAYQNYKRHLNKWLKILQLPPEILAVTYKGETYYLPL